MLLRIVVNYGTYTRSRGTHIYLCIKG